MSYQLEARNIKGGQNAFTCLPKEPTWKTTAARWHYLTVAKYPDIIQIIDIYWGKMKEKKLHVHADRWVNFVCLRITSRFRFLTSLSEWMEKPLLNIRKMERAETCHRLSIGSGEPCHPTHQWLIVKVLNNALQISPRSRHTTIFVC